MQVIRNQTLTFLRQPRIRALSLVWNPCLPQEKQTASESYMEAQNSQHGNIQHLIITIKREDPCLINLNLPLILSDAY